MVQSMKNGIFYLELEAASAIERSKQKQSLKMEDDDCLDLQYGPDFKRSRVTYESLQWGMVYNKYPVVPPLQYNPLDEPSPLGLKLKKSPSLVELIQSHLTLNASKPANSGETISSVDRDGKSFVGAIDKMKASNIPASVLRIGKWEYWSMHEADLVMKFYFAKHKVVWEVLESGLKSKIEIQWSDITGLKADCPEMGESSLKLVLARQPLFFRETNPQPRKHTLWQPCTDFTKGEASVNRVHFLKCPPGMLQKHYEKLIQSDSRLNFLSRQPDTVVDPLYFGNGRSSVFEDLNPKSHFFDSIKASESSLSPGFAIASLSTIPSATHPTDFKFEQQVHGGKLLDNLSLESFSPNSVMEINPLEIQGVMKGNTGRFQELHGLRTSMSKPDVVNCLVNMIPPAAYPESVNPVDRKAQLDMLAELLLHDNDSHVPPPTDEKSVMARVNSLHCLLEMDDVEKSISLKENQCDTLINPTPTASNYNKVNAHGVFFSTEPSVLESLSASDGEESGEYPSMKPTGMIKVDSFSDLLLNLPRIASLPKFMNFSQDNQSHFN